MGVNGRWVEASIGDQLNDFMNMRSGVGKTRS